jgi:hypothetical protein
MKKQLSVIEVTGQPPSIMLISRITATINEGSTDELARIPKHSSPPFDVQTLWSLLMFSELFQFHQFRSVHCD